MPTTRSQTLREQANIQEIEKKHAEEIRSLKAKSKKAARSSAEKVKNLKRSLDDLKKKVHVYEERFQDLEKVIVESNMYELRTGIQQLYREWYC